MPGPVANAFKRLPGPLGAIGKKHVEILSQWLGTAGAYGATAGALVCYLTDWRVVVDYIPFYNGKFTPSE